VITIPHGFLGWIPHDSYSFVRLVVVVEDEDDDDGSRLAVVEEGCRFEQEPTQNQRIYCMIFQNQDVVSQDSSNRRLLLLLLYS